MKWKFLSKIRFDLYGIYRTIIFFCAFFSFNFLLGTIVIFLFPEEDIISEQILYDPDHTKLNKLLLFVIFLFIGTVLYIVDRIKRSRENKRLCKKYKSLKNEIIDLVISK